MDGDLIMVKITHIPNWINGQEVQPEGNAWLEKFNPHSGELLCHVADSSKNDTHYAIDTGEDDEKYADPPTPFNMLYKTRGKKIRRKGPRSK